MEEEYELIMSPLCRKVHSNGKSVEVEMYGLAGSGEWSLEMIDEYGNSTVWEDLFATDQEALDEFNDTINTKGIDGLIGQDSWLASMPRMAFPGAWLVGFYLQQRYSNTPGFFTMMNW